MKKILLFVWVASLCGCLAPPNAHITSRPKSVVIATDIHVWFDTGRVRFAAEFVVPAGRYVEVKEDQDFVFYGNASAAITKTHRDADGETVQKRPGGFMLKKSRGVWVLYTLGAAEDLAEVGVEGPWVRFESRIGDQYVRRCAVIGRTDEKGCFVRLPDTSWGYVDKPEAIGFDGSVPITTK